jgi:hypothetical protein
MDTQAVEDVVNGLKKLLGVDELKRQILELRTMVEQLTPSGTIPPATPPEPGMNSVEQTIQNLSELFNDPHYRQIFVDFVCADMTNNATVAEWGNVRYEIDRAVICEHIPVSLHTAVNIRRISECFREKFSGVFEPEGEYQQSHQLLPASIPGTKRRECIKFVKWAIHWGDFMNDQLE